MATSPSLLFQNAAGQLALDQAGFLRTNWSANARTLADTQALFKRMTQALQQQGLSRILINQVAMPPFSSDEQQWIAQYWLPSAVQGGYRYGAIVVATNIFTRLATSLVTTNVGGLPLRYRSFDDETQAVAWLLKRH